MERPLQMRLSFSAQAHPRMKPARLDSLLILLQELYYGHLDLKRTVKEEKKESGEKAVLTAFQGSLLQFR